MRGTEESSELQHHLHFLARSSSITIFHITPVVLEVLKAAPQNRARLRTRVVYNEKMIRILPWASGTRTTAEAQQTSSFSTLLPSARCRQEKTCRSSCVKQTWIREEH
ncbi:hypothetical protein GN956_G5132 [Arapaima gigas]